MRKAVLITLVFLFFQFPKNHYQAGFVEPKNLFPIPQTQPLTEPMDYLGELDLFLSPTTRPAKTPEERIEKLEKEIYKLKLDLEILKLEFEIYKLENKPLWIKPKRGQKVLAPKEYKYRVYIF